MIFKFINASYFDMNSINKFDETHFCPSWCKCCEENLKLRPTNDKESTCYESDNENCSESSNTHQYPNKKRTYDDMING